MNEEPYDPDEFDDEPYEEPEFDCPRFWIAGEGGSWFCPMQGTEECDWECPHS